MDALLADALQADLVLNHAAPHLPLARAPRIAQTPEGMYTFTLEAPGVAASDIAIEVHDGPRITLRGASKQAGLLRRLDYSLPLPHDADAKAAVATAADGLITVRVPKVAEQLISVGSTPAPAEDNVYTLTLVAAGIAPSDLELSVTGSVLKVSGRSKRTGAVLERECKLPRNADTAGAHATSVDGILTVTVPKKQPAEVKRIEVNAPAAVSVASTLEREEQHPDCCEAASKEATKEFNAEVAGVKERVAEAEVTGFDEETDAVTV